MNLVEDRDKVSLGSVPSMLLAVYDLAVSPPTFDIFPFLIASEIARKDTGCKDIHFILVPSCDDAGEDFKAKMGGISDENMQWRSRQIIIPACTLLKTCTSITQCANRKQATLLLDQNTGPVYPENYSVASPIAGFSVAEVEAATYRGEQAPSLQATEQALVYAGQWIDEYSNGRKPVSITLREAKYGEDKNSDPVAWMKFAASLDQQIYFPFLIRDTDRVFEKTPEFLADLAQFSVAAVNLELRAAIYELSYLNMIGSSGPTQMVLFDRSVRCLIHNLGVPGWHDTQPEAYQKNYGIEMGDQLRHTTPYQRLVWGADDGDSIARHFELMTRYIEQGEAGLKTANERKFFSPNDEAPLIFAERMFVGRQWGPAKKIYRHLLADDPDNGELCYRLGVAETWGGNPRRGMEFFQTALELGFDGSDVFLARGEAFLFLGETDQAAANLQHAVDLNDQNFDGLLRLGLLFENLGMIAEAHYWVERAVELCPDSTDAINYLHIIDSKLKTAV